MTEAIEKFDPSKLVDQVRERVRNTFAELIPEEEWKKLVQREITFFLQESIKRRNNYGNEYVDRGALAEIVNAELSAKVREMLKAELQSPDWGAWFDGQKSHLGPKIKEALVEAAPQMFASIVGMCLRDLSASIGR